MYWWWKGRKWFGVKRFGKVGEGGWGLMLERGKEEGVKRMEEELLMCVGGRL